MIDECVYYIKLQPYYSYIPFETFVIRFLNSALFRTVFDKIELPSRVPSMSALVKKEILSIEIQNLFMKYVNLAKFDAKSNQKKLKTNNYLTNSNNHSVKLKESSQMQRKSFWKWNENLRKQKGCNSENLPLKKIE